MHVRLRYVELRKSRLHHGIVLAAVVVGGLAGCNGNSVSAPGEGSSDGEPKASSHDGPVGDRRATLKAILAAKGRPTTVLASMRVYGAPLDVVQAGLASATARRDKSVKEINGRLDELAENIERAEQRLRAAEDALQSEEDELRRSKDEDQRPAPLRSTDRSSRSELDELLATQNRQRVQEQQRGKQRAVEEGLRQERESAALQLERLQEEKRAVELSLQIATKLKPFEFLSTLERSPQRMWMTNSEGTAEIVVPERQQWVIWASTPRRLPGGGTDTYRWIALLTDTGDTNDTIYFGDSNRFDGILPAGLTPGASPDRPVQ